MTRQRRHTWQRWIDIRVRGLAWGLLLPPWMLLVRISERLGLRVDRRRDIPRNCPVDGHPNTPVDVCVGCRLGVHR